MGRSIIALALVALVSACASTAPPSPDQAPRELVAVPFFPQTEYQCGPAALATVLVHSGVATSPDALAPQVYLPGRQGSLQLELLAAARRAGRIPFTLEATPQALLAELEAGNPVLVLQNLGLRSLPRWHYAVVVGYEPTRERVILRSGSERRRQESWTHFIASWARADFWGLVVPRLGEIPASARGDSIGSDLARQEGLLQPGVTLAAWESALARWPQEPDILFATANARRTAADQEAAAALYRRLLLLAPEHMAGRNNFADLLLQAGCPAAAAGIVAPAQAAAPGLAALVQDAVSRTAEAIASALSNHPTDPDDCRALTGNLPTP
ncbi:MAG: PA2778 family cysteine peptidase [Haliea sp.]